MPKHDLGALSDFADDTPTRAEADGRSVVVVRQGDIISVLDHDCPHLGAPLSEGLVHGSTLVCPWHRAVFGLGDGAFIEPPACENLQRYPASVEDGRVLIDVAKDQGIHPAPALARRKDDSRHIAVIGTGAAGFAALQTLRAEGFEGRLSVVSEERVPPYERTKLSKSLIRAPEDAILRSSDWFADADIEAHLGCRVVAATGRDIMLDTDQTIAADVVIAAPGATPTVPDIPGTDLTGVMTLRRLEDAVALADALRGGMKIAIVGEGFIGFEAAALLAGEDHDVTLLAQHDVPFKPILGERVGKALRAKLEAAGVPYRTGAVKALLGNDGRIEAVKTADGTIPADLVLLATGVRPASHFLPKDMVDDDGGVTTDPHLRAPGHDSLFLAGDIARVPTGDWGILRTEHWRWAQQLGRLAAVNALGQERTYDGVPFFWTAQATPGSHVYIGHTEEFDDIHYTDKPEQDDFIAWYLKDGRIAAAFGHGHTDTLSRLERRMAKEGPVPPSDWL